ncbi:MAG: hypothetical protein AABX23_03795 [Nanoarchaeota archaeon]
MSKKGLSHIEFVISFVIFIGFVVFAFVFFNPLQSQRTLKSTMDYAWIEVSEETKEIVETYAISIDSSQLVPSIVSLKIPGISMNYNATVEDEDGVIIETYKNNGFVHFDRNGTYFFRIRYSPIIKNSPASINGQSIENKYFISSSDTEELYFESLFLELNRSYFSNYTELKRELNLPNRLDFGFAVQFSDSQIMSLNEIPDNVEVLSKNDRIEIIRNSGRREYADIRVLVW